MFVPACSIMVGVFTPFYPAALQQIASPSLRGRGFLFAGLFARALSGSGLQFLCRGKGPPRKENMGDRGNVICNDEWSDADVVLYTHWGGSMLPNTVAKALNSPQGRSRWGDSSYLNRIIFCQMIASEGGDYDGEIGFGIGTKKAGDANTIVTVYHADRLVKVRVGSYTSKLLGFEKFIAAHLEE